MPLRSRNDSGKNMKTCTFSDVFHSFGRRTLASGKSAAAWGVVAACLVPIAVGQQAQPPPSEPPPLAQQDDSNGATSESQRGFHNPPQLLKTEHLPNAVRVHQRVISGGLPEGEAAFQELAELNIKTIISVDGAKPDEELATRYGMRYVHLPHGYDGISAERIAELAKAVRDLDGPIYVHCHHGKHRSPAAAGAACVAAGMIDNRQASELLAVAGTGKNYRGLFAAVERQTRLPAEKLDALKVDFRPSVPIPPMAEAMVELEHTFGKLQQVRKLGWTADVSKPDLYPLHEATLLQEHFKEMMRTPESTAQGEEFGQILENSEKLATKILAQLSVSENSATVDTMKLNGWLDGIGNDCKTCHQQFRDNAKLP